MSRELDAKVAEAMGLCPHWLVKQIEEDALGNSEAYHRCTRCGKAFYGLAYSEGQFTKPYSTDWTTSKTAVDWMTERGWDFGLSGSISVDDDPHSIWCAGFAKNKRYSAESDNLPYAICLAILRAMGLDGEGEEG